MSERERFEQWGNAKGTMGDSWSGDHYRNSLHEAAWQSWQAAIQAERERCANWLRDNGYQQAGDAIRRGEGV